MSQGPEHSWLRRVTHVAMIVHHTKCTITHAHVGIYIYIYIYIDHAQYYHIEQKSKTDIPNIPRIYSLARYKKYKTDIVIHRECGPSKEQERQRVQVKGEP